MFLGIVKILTKKSRGYKYVQRAFLTPYKYSLHHELVVLESMTISLLS